MKEILNSLFFRRMVSLPGIDFNIAEQLELLVQFKYNKEIAAMPIEKSSRLESYLNKVPSFRVMQNIYTYAFNTRYSYLLANNSVFTW